MVERKRNTTAAVRAIKLGRGREGRLVSTAIKKPPKLSLSGLQWYSVVIDDS